MQDDPITDNEDEPARIDAEAWEIAFKPYGEPQHANSAHYAFDLARLLMAVSQCLQTQPPNVSHAAAELDEACKVLFPFTEFRKAGYDLYRVVIEGRTTRAHENLMDSLGITY
jgi:hypothetical protein